MGKQFAGSRSAKGKPFHYLGGYVKLGLETALCAVEHRPVQWNKVALIGVGLLGGSLGLALRQRQLAGTVVGPVRRRASIRECEAAGAVHRATLDLEEAVRDADLVVLCTPIAGMAELARKIVTAMERNAVVTDVGSVKGSVVKALEAPIEQAGGHFVGSHPMAGSEKTGVSAARADLFEGAVCVTTPSRRTLKSALQRVEALWKSLGSRVVRLSPELHDELVGRSSHLPHLLAAVLARTVLAPGRPSQQPQLCANGFRDTTRIASGSPEMWRDIALANRKNLSAALNDFIRQLQAFDKLLKAGHGERISKYFEEAKRRRDQWRKGRVSPSPE